MASLLTTLIGESNGPLQITNIDGEYNTSEFANFSGAGGDWRERVGNENTEYITRDKRLITGDDLRKELPLDHYTDGKQSVSRIPLGDGRNAYFIQIRVGIIQSKRLDDGRFVNLPRDIQSLNVFLCV